MLMYRVAALLAYAILETLWRTSRMRIVGLERLTALAREQQAVVPVFWVCRCGQPATRVGAADAS